LPEFVPAFSAVAEPPLPSGDFLCPPRIAASVQRAAEKLTLWTARFPFAPRRPFTFGDRPADHRSSSATLHSARLFR